MTQFAELPGRTQHLGVVLPDIRRRPAGFARCFLEVDQRRQGAHGAHARIVYSDHGAVGDDRGVIHGLDAGAIGLGGDVAVLQIDLHPLVGSFFQLLLQYLPAQEFLVLEIQRGNPGEALVLQQRPEANGPEVPLDVRHPLIGVLQPCAVAGSHRNVANGGEALGPGASRGNRSGSRRRSCMFTSPPSPTLLSWGEARVCTMLVCTHCPRPAQVTHAERAQDAAHCGLAGVPATGVNRRIDRAVAVGLALQVEHAAGLGGNDALVPFHPTERSFLPKASDGAVDQPRMELRQIVVPQAPVRHVSRAERLHQHVSLGGQLDRLLAPCRGAEVQRDALFATVPRDPGRLEAERITAGRFNLDDFSAVIGQHQGAESPGHPQREIQDGQACAWSCHGSPPGLAVWVPACVVSGPLLRPRLQFLRVGKINAARAYPVFKARASRRG